MGPRMTCAKCNDTGWVRGLSYNKTCDCEAFPYAENNYSEAIKEGIVVLRDEIVKLRADLKIAIKALETIKKFPITNAGDKYPEDDHMTKIEAAFEIRRIAREALERLKGKL